MFHLVLQSSGNLIFIGPFPAAVPSVANRLGSLVLQTLGSVVTVMKRILPLVASGKTSPMLSNPAGAVVKRLVSF